MYNFNKNNYVSKKLQYNSNQTQKINRSNSIGILRHLRFQTFLYGVLNTQELFY